MRHTRFQGAIVKDDQIVLVRHYSRNRDRHYWVMPGGGIESGESELECIVREMREETGLDVRVERLLLDLRNPEGRFYLRQKTYLCTPVGGELIPGDEPEVDEFDITAAEWFSLSQPQTWWDRLQPADWVVPVLTEIARTLGHEPHLPEAVEQVTPVPPVDHPGELWMIREGTDADADSLSHLLFSGQGALTHLVADRRGHRLEPRRLLADLQSRSVLVAQSGELPLGVAVASEEWSEAWDETPRSTGGTSLTVHLVAVGNPAASITAGPAELAGELLQVLSARAGELGYRSLRLCLPADPPAGPSAGADAYLRRAGIDQPDPASLVTGLGFRCIGFQSGPEGGTLWYERRL